MKKTAFIFFALLATSFGYAQSIPITGDGYHLYGPNTTWGEYLKVGGNGRGTSKASVVATNGNLHLDSKDGNATYLNHYSKGNTFLNLNGGNVGIGTSAPAGKLHVKGETYVDGGWLRVKGSKGIFFQDFGGGFVMTDNSWIRTYGNKNFYHNTGAMRTDGTLQVGPSGNRFVVNTAGKVGIRTTSPDETLHVNGTTTITADIGVPTSNHWQTGSHTLELQNSDQGEVVLSFHRAGYSNAAIKHPASGGIAFSANGFYNQTHMHLKSNGYLGIGTSNPGSKMEISNSNNLRLWLNKNDQSSISFVPNNGNSIFHINHGLNNDLKISHGATVGAVSIMTIKNSGSIGIGTNNPDAKLAVNGNIHTKEVKVDLVGWPDYVFEDSYQLPTLSQVEKHIKEKGHLQNIPSAKEVAKNGIKLGEMNKLLLEKIEELTLYTIDQEKEIKALHQKINALEQQNSKIQKLEETLKILQQQINN
ncbi:shufflon system plasmid conjugative transfer pilus tip adhesin PilV [Aquimarina spongiae]|uniref:Shufflon protein, N-terminal constant region n=1 Tax=Aquimarina spongiae TaxID=570521 RepID=A0A1M6BGV6_9FLAO|nr:shufflon system plasmid conjugative transfer pilus tip adhesin PilV [Aquimarina spongiae]SHI47916.1 shufflon protein, N-terminal constant region [Aquimarina spongiae]